MQLSAYKKSSLPRYSCHEVNSQSLTLLTIPVLTGFWRLMPCVMT